MLCDLQRHAVPSRIGAVGHLDETHATGMNQGEAWMDTSMHRRLLHLSVALFLVSGAIHLIIGVLALMFSDLELGRRILVISTRTDTELFGSPPSLLVETNAELALFRSLVFNGVAGSLIQIGIFVSAVAWFGLRRGVRWTYWTLVATGLVMVPFWYLTFRPYVQAGISIGFSDLPPIFWIPATVLLPAVICGWLGLRGDQVGGRSRSSTTR